MQKEERLKQLFIQYNFEISNLWQRSLFLFGFLVLIYTAYGVLQLNLLQKFDFKIHGDIFMHIVSFFICFVGLIFSMLWIFMANGSKNIQESYEKEIKSTDENALVSLGNSKNRYSPSKINIMIGWINLAIFTLFAGFHLYHINKCATFFIIVIIVLLYFGFAYFLRGNDNK